MENEEGEEKKGEGAAEEEGEFEPGKLADQLDGEVADNSGGDQGEHDELQDAGIDVCWVERENIDRVAVVFGYALDGAEPEDHAMGNDAGRGKDKAAGEDADGDQGEGGGQVSEADEDCGCHQGAPALRDRLGAGQVEEEVFWLRHEWIELAIEDDPRDLLHPAKADLP